MPLDVKPLSPARRVASVVFMFVLLAGSLGFANYLVWRHDNPRGGRTGGVIFPVPPGAFSPLLVNTNLQNIGPRPPLFTSVRLPDGMRRFALFSVADLTGGDATEGVYLKILFDAFTGEPSETEPFLREASLGGHPAWEIERTFGTGLLVSPEGTPLGWQPSSFAMMRLTIVNRRVIAVGFSGAGTLSQADRQYFDAYCESVQTGIAPTTRPAPPHSQTLPRRRLP